MTGNIGGSEAPFVLNSVQLLIGIRRVFSLFPDSNILLTIWKVNFVKCAAESVPTFHFITSPTNQCQNIASHCNIVILGRRTQRIQGYTLGGSGVTSQVSVDMN